MVASIQGQRANFDKEMTTIRENQRKCYDRNQINRNEGCLLLAHDQT